MNEGFNFALLANHLTEFVFIRLVNFLYKGCLFYRPNTTQPFGAKTKIQTDLLDLTL